MCSRECDDGVDTPAASLGEPTRLAREIVTVAPASRVFGRGGIIRVHANGDVSLDCGGRVVTGRPANDP